MKTTVEKRERLRMEEITITRGKFQARVGQAYNQGRVNALLMVGKTVPEIAELLHMKEDMVRHLHGTKKNEREGI